VEQRAALSSRSLYQEQEACGMLNHPSVNWKKLLGQGLIEQYVDFPDESWTLPNSLFVLNGNGTGLDNVEFNVDFL
jgi:hypothetical protein